MLSTVQKAEAINKFLHENKGRQRTEETISELTPVKVDNALEMLLVHTDLKAYYDVSVNFQGAPGVIMLVDIIDLDEQITKKYVEYVDKDYSDE
ncbi:hypothetical protein CMI37_39070 [Candidatus Pacearchaeota archaeon]|nr:hypothetical protein [Candidatus Pacearchaeota archaeon]|tara:strand:- start:5336 stop:5617 length:282 start_codon:yes stop_codon:yes gene_type:complete